MAVLKEMECFMWYDDVIDNHIFYNQQYSYNVIMQYIQKL